MKYVENYLKSHLAGVLCIHGESIFYLPKHIIKSKKTKLKKYKN